MPVISTKLQDDAWSFRNTYIRCKKQYIHTLLHRKALYDFENLCVQIGNTTTMHLNQILLDLGM